MSENLLVDLTLIVVLGVGATWLAWRLRLPSILLLLLAGFLIGPITGLLQPDALLDELLFPLVSLSVALILYEGGLTLNFGEIRKESHVVLRLITVGVLVTWSLGTLSAHYLLGLDFGMALLLSAILVVTGPTVVGPLLQQVRPKGKVGSTLKWEGILIDPVGALLAVLVFEIILGGELHQAPFIIAEGIFFRVLVGVISGLLAAVLVLFLLRRFWIPDFLQNGVSIMVVLLAFTGSNLVLEESGLVAVMLMGVVLANQKYVSVKHIVEFKENLRVILIATLFILLAARLSLDDIAGIGPEAFLFLAVLVFVARPLTVFLSTIGSELSNRERLFMSWLAPRGIVAASIASIFAFRLLETGQAGANQLAPLTFFVIVGTVLLYGLTAKPVARLLKVSEENPQGFLLVGAHPFSRALAKALQLEGFRALLIDSNFHHIAQARMDGLETYYGNAYSEHALEEIEFTGLGRLLALTSNEEVNSLSVLHFADIFGHAEVYQLATVRDKNKDERKQAALHFNGRVLFARELTYSVLDRRLEEGAIIKATNITKQFDVSDYRAMHPKAILLFLRKPDGTLIINTRDEELVPVAGDTLYSLTGELEPSRRAPVENAGQLASQALPQS